jgi:ribosomal protein S18 acetylase RimI-like enzyme
MEITIRPAIPQDYDDLCRLMGQVDTLHHRHLPHIFHKPDGPARKQMYILSLISDEDTGLFVAEVEGQIVGLVNVLARDAPSISLFVPRRLAIIDNLAVSRGFRRTGIGRALMQEAERWAAVRGASAVELNVYEFNRGAIAFYQALGYEPLSRRMSRALTPDGDWETKDG